MTSSIVPCLPYADAPKAIAWLCDAFGFQRHAVYEDGEGGVTHAQLTFATQLTHAKGMIMLGSARGGAFGELRATPAEPGAAAALSIRPEHLYTEPGAGRTALGGTVVEEASFFGTYHQCSARMEGLDQPVKLRLPQKRMVQPGENLALYGEAADMVLLTR